MKDAIQKLNDTDIIYSMIASRNSLLFFMHFSHIRMQTVPDGSIDTSFSIEFLSIALQKHSKYTQELNKL